MGIPAVGHVRLRHWFFWAIALMAGSAIIAQAQHAGLGVAAVAQAEKPRPKMEYLSQEFQAEVAVQTLNDLDNNGWEIIQIIPIWSLKNEGPNNSLVAKSFQVFGRRPTKGPN